MSSHQLNLTPCRIWLGLTIPGKKMMRMLEPNGGVESTIEVVRRNGGLPLPDRPLRQVAEKTRGQRLIHMYQSDPWVALHFAALGLHAENQNFSRNPTMLYESILSDVRDFLKLRFRTTGRVDPDEKVPPYVRWALENGDTEPPLDDPRYVFAYLVDSVINELDNLSSRRPNTSDNSILRLSLQWLSPNISDNSILRLRNVLRWMVRLVYPYQSDADTLEGMFDESLRM